MLMKTETKTVHYFRTLGFYDWILMYQAVDDDGNFYIGLTFDSRTGIFCVVPCTDEDEKKLFAQEMSVRDLYILGVERGWYTSLDPWGSKPFEITRQYGLIPEHYMPLDIHYIDEDDLTWGRYPFDGNA